MAVRYFQPAKKADGAPEVQQMVATSAASFKIGSPVQRNAGEPSQIEEATGGATVTGIIGVSMAGCVDGLPDGHGDTPFGTTIPIVKAGQDVEFFAQVTNGATAVVVDGDGSLAGLSVGIIKNSGYWTLDAGDTGNAVARITKEVPELNGVMFKFLPSATAS